MVSCPGPLFWRPQGGGDVLLKKELELGRGVLCRSIQVLVSLVSLKSLS